jgi:hypothetical protein
VCAGCQPVEGAVDHVLDQCIGGVPGTQLLAPRRSGCS